MFGAGNAGVIARGGRLHRRDDEGRSEAYSDILARAGLVEIEGRGSGAADPAAQSAYAMHAHGAVFAEVKVDPDFGQIRVTRLVGAFAAGTVINPRMVQSQYYGGMIWGISFALHEQAVMDPRSGRTMNPNLAEYHVPVNADVPSLEAILVEERDPHVNAAGDQGRGRDRDHRHGWRDRECGVARDRRSGAPVPDHARSVDRRGRLRSGEPAAAGLI